MVQRAPEMYEQEDQRPAERPERRAQAHRAPRGSQSEENVPKISRKTQFQADETGECVRRAGVSRKGTYQASIDR